MAKKGLNYPWRFFRAGGVDQVTLSKGSDLENLAKLDQKLWVALACPTRGLQIESRSLDFVDTDHDGRIRPPEVLAAIVWAKEVFRNLDDLFDRAAGVPLASISDTTDLGRDVLAGARRILENLGNKDEPVITIEHVADTDKIFRETKFNGDGVVPADSAADPETQAIITDILTTFGGVTDRSGKPGVTAEKVTRFFDQAATYTAWLDQADADAAIRPLGEATDRAALALAAVHAKVDDYFARCRLIIYDGRVAPSLNASEAEVTAFAGGEIASEDPAVSKLPVARCEGGRPLPLGEGLNPAWMDRVSAFAREVVTPIFGFGKDSLSEGEWSMIKERFAAHRAWMARRPVESEVAALGIDRVRSLARGNGREVVSALIAEDSALAAENSQVESVEKMIRFRRDLVPLLRNFVNFADFYGARRGAFQAGTLFVDGRSCDLCLPVADVPKHATLAGLARAYLAYCDCTRRKDLDKQTIVAVVTGGDVDNLMVGRNGVFYDRKGDDWDATITRVVENPISVRQAFWAPYKRFMRLIEEQIAKRASAAEADSDKALQATAVRTATADQKPEAADPKAVAPKKIDVGTVAAIGVAVGGIATFFSSIVATFLGLGMWMPAGVLALVLAISGPSMLIAWLKLRQRNIGPILDANGWAVNALARINVPFGGALTALPSLPVGATRSLDDPFAEKRRPWGAYATGIVVLALAFAWLFGKFDTYLPEGAKASTVRRMVDPSFEPMGAGARP